MKTNDIQAFPVPESEKYYGQDGMTLRDYFAAHVMQGLIAVDRVDPEHWKTAAHTAYVAADYMLEAREK